MVHQSCFLEIGIRLLEDLLINIQFCSAPVNEQLYRKLLKRKSEFLVNFLQSTSLFCLPLLCCEVLTERLSWFFNQIIPKRCSSLLMFTGAVRCWSWSLKSFIACYADAMCFPATSKRFSCSGSCLPNPKTSQLQHTRLSVELAPSTLSRASVHIKNSTAAR